MKTVQYLDEAKKILSVESDYALAKWMVCHQRRITEYRKGLYGLTNVDASRIAVLLKVEPIEVIQNVGIEFAKTDEDRRYWEGFFVKAKGAAASVLLIVLITFAVPLITIGSQAMAGESTSNGRTNYILCEVNGIATRVFQRLFV